MNLFTKINNFLNNHSKITVIILTGFCLLFFGYLNYSPYFPDPDGYYHLKMAEIYRDQWSLKTFPFLQFSILKDHFTDHQFFYHHVLVPFIKIFGALPGIKIAHTIFETLFILSFYWLLRELKIKNAFWFTLFLFLNNLFVFRIFLIKAQPLVLTIVVLSLICLIKKKVLPLVLLSFLYVWTYAGWGLLFLLTILFLFINGWENKKFFTKENLITIAGVALGLSIGIITHPNFPQNLYFYYIQSIILPFFSPANLSKPLEWLPFSFAEFVSAVYLPLLIFLPAVYIFFHYHHYNAKELFFFICSVIFLVLMINSKRHIEYLIPFLTIFSALIYSTASQIPQIKIDFNEYLQNQNFNKIKNLFAWLVLATFIIVIPIHAYQIKKDNQNHSFDYLKNASEFLKANTEPGDIIFHPIFSDFPPLFLHNDKDYYISGLAPIFTYVYDQNISEDLEKINNGQTADIYDIIKNRFKAKFIVAPFSHPNFLELCKKDNRLIPVFSDNQTIIFKIN